MAQPTMSDSNSAHQDLLAPTLAGRWNAVRERIAAAARRSGRTPEQILLVVVTKSASVDQIRELVTLGQRDFAENRVQSLSQRSMQIEEFVKRPAELSPNATVHQIRWHMIGTLQRNKVRRAIEIARLIHGIDTLRIAEEIHIAAGKSEMSIDCLIEVNMAGEASKQGIAPPAVRHFVEQLETMVNIRVRGLMCMAPNTRDEPTIRGVFTRTYELFQEIRARGSTGSAFDFLSMGMSNDYEIAIECGANIVRVGSAIIGPPTPECVAEQASWSIEER
ncbi:MAG: YggS family pyridoxal phosphate-dependent enzyme [Planctomycetota bacterium]|nr:YggS family pyridoxal phosphate-dependent enzyme [Planctomycetota bacterium]